MNVSRFLHRNSPVIFAGFGIGATIGAVLMASKAAPVAKEKIEEWEDHQCSNWKDAPIRTKFDILAPIYAPTAAMTTIAVTSIIMANVAHRRQIAVVGTLLAIADRNAVEWQEAALETVGAKKVEKIRERYVEPKGDVPSNLIYDTDHILVEDHYNGRYFRAQNIESLNRAANRINELMLNEDYAPINDFYSLIGLPRIQYGDDIGWWIEDGLLELVIDAKVHDEEPCIVMSFNLEPRQI